MLLLDCRQIHEMHLDLLVSTPDLHQAGLTALTAERLGFSCMWTNETAHDPFLPLVPAALSTSRLLLGTSVAIAFPRSPTVMAHTAWDLAHASGGRFILGLGTQVRAHIERRFSVPWDAPVDRLRDYIGALRAVWHCWQTGERLRYDGQFYTLKLMTPFFSPLPLPDPSHTPPIFIAGVNRHLCKLAGEVCDGFHVHPLHSIRYLREHILPWIEDGLALSGRQRQQFQVCTGNFAIVGRGEARDRAREEVRKQVAFYASTPSYRTLLTAHGWADVGEELSRLAARGRWHEMGALISADMLAEFAVEGDTLAEAALKLKERYTEVVDRVAFYIPFVPGERDDEWQSAAATLGGTP
jgi:probable F420-dependent oxidoreductase